MRRVPVGDFIVSDKMRQYVNDVLDSGQISYGKYSRRFEQEFARLHGCEYAILSNSGTSALQVALQAMKEIHGWPDGSQVIIPATTFIATANIVRHCRMRPVFVDVSPLTYNMDMEQVAPLLSKDVKAVIPVHLLGQPANVARLKEIIAASGFEIRVIEDSAECMFATHHGKPVGSLGDIAGFSTYNAHVLTTGVGGLSTTNNPEYAAKMRALVNHGLQLDQLNPDENFSPRPMAGRRFKFDTYGHSYRITELEAALGVAQLEDYEAIVCARQRNAARYRERLTAINHRYGDLLHFQELEYGNTNIYMMFGISLRKTRFEKSRLTNYLNDNGVETRDIPSCLGHPIYSWACPADYPVSDWIERSSLYVGSHPGLSLSDVDYVCVQIDKYFQEHG